MTFDEIIKKAGKRIKKHVYYVKNGVTTNVSDESVERIKFDLQSPLIGTSINGCEITLKEKIDGDIYVEIEARYSTYVQTKTYGPYYLKEEPTYQAEKKTYLHKTYDSILKSMVTYQPVNLTYPVTIFAFFQAVVAQVGYTTNIASLPNGNQEMSTDIFNNIGFTYRDVLDDIAVANGVLFYVDGNELKIAPLGGDSITIDDDILKNQNIKFGQHFGPINTIVLSRSGESDNVYYPAILPENPREFKIKDNQLMNENNRADYLPALYNQLNGIEYDIYDTELTGWGGLRPLQTVNFETGNNEYSSYIFNNETTLTDGYKQAIYNDLPEETVTDYKAASTEDKAINSAYIIVRKNEAEIESLANKVVELSETKEGQGSVTLENAHQGQLYQLSIKGQISLLFPQSENNLYGYPLVPSNDLVPSNELVPSSPVPYGNEILYPSNQLFSKSSNLIVDNTKYELDFDFLNYLSADVADEFVYDNGICYIIRRVGIDSSGNKYALEKEVIEPRKGVVINVRNNSTISLESFNSAFLKATYLLNNEYTDNFTTQAEVQSQVKQMADSITSTVSETYATKKDLQDTDVRLNSTIQQTANSITSTVSETYETKTNASNTYETKSNAQTNYTQITQTTNSISLEVANKVGNDEIISKINQSSEQVTINANKIDLTGKTINLSADNVSIAGDVLSINNQGKMTLYDDVLNYWEAGSFVIQSTEEQDRKNLITSLAMVLKDGVRYSSFTANSLDIYDEFANSGRWQSIGLSTLFIYDDKYVPSIALSDGTTRSESVTVITSRHIITPILTQTSLAEQKKDFQKLENALEIIKKIEIYKYQLKNESENAKKHIGFVIGDDFKYSEEVTSQNNDGVDLYSFISVCCKAIQEHQVEIENLKKEMEELKNGKNRI